MRRIRTRVLLLPSADLLDEREHGVDKLLSGLPRHHVHTLDGTELTARHLRRKRLPARRSPARGGGRGGDSLLFEEGRGGYALRMLWVYSGLFARSPLAALGTFWREGRVDNGARF